MGIGKTQQNTNTEKCKKYINANIYNVDNNHASPRNRKCPYYPTNMTDLLKNVFGESNSFTRRIAHFHNGKFKIPVKENSIQSVKKLADCTRNVTVKSQLFAAYYILKMIEKDAIQVDSNASPLVTTIFIQ